MSLMLWPCLRLMINVKVQISKQVKGKPHDMANMNHLCIWRWTCFKVKGKHSQDFQLPLILCSQNGDATCGSWDSYGVQNLCPKQLLKRRIIFFLKSWDTNCHIYFQPLICSFEGSNQVWLDINKASKNS